MKKTSPLLLFFIWAIGLWACHSTPQQKQEGAGVVSLHALPYSDTFYTRVQHSLSSYYLLKDAMVNSDTAGANQAALQLKQCLDSIPLAELKKDSTKYENVKETIGSIVAEIAGLAGEQALQGKRQEFQLISDMLYDMIKVTGLKHHTVYRQFCPMAFDDKGAYWLSDQEEIANPYYGKKMLNCGEVKETIRY